MANVIEKFIQDRFVNPAIKQATDPLKKELSKAQFKLEQKDFDLLTDLSGRYGVGQKINKRRILDAYVSWAYANISVIAERFADIQFELYQYTRGKDQKKIDIVEEHPVLDLLLRVNDYQTKWDLLYLWACYMLSMGEAAWYLVGRTTPETEPKEIWPLRPDYIKIIPGNLEKNEFIKAYEYHIPGKDKVTFQPWEILFFKVPHPTNAYRGYGIMEAAATDVSIDYYASAYNKNFFSNFARPDAVLQTENKLSDEVHDRLEKKWAAKFQGTENAGRTAVLEQGLKYQAIQPTAKDMDFLEQQKWSRDKIMALFKNTKVILGITEDVNRANAEAGEYVWLKHNIKPRMQRLVDYLNEFLVPIYGDNLFLSFKDPLPESVELKLAEYEKGYNKWLTTNEIREREGLDPVDGGDVLYVPFSVVPINGIHEDQEESAEEQPKSLEMRVQKGKGQLLLKKFAKEVQRIEQREWRTKKLLGDLAKAMEHVLPKEATKKKAVAVKEDRLADGTINKEIQEKRWQQFIKVTSVYEQLVKGRVEGVLRKHEKKTLKLIGQDLSKGLKTKAADNLLPDQDEFVKVSIDALTPIFQKIALDQGSDIYQFLGMQDEFTIDQILRENLDTIALDSSKSYIGTVSQKIKNQLVAGILAGEGIEKLKKRIRETYAGIKPREAERVARTESIRTANATTQDAFRRSGVVTGKQWFTALDERVDGECAALDGKIVDIDENFEELEGVPTPYKDVPYPPLHPNCRCTLSPVIISKSLKQNIVIDPEEEEKEFISKIDDLIKAVRNG